MRAVFDRAGPPLLWKTPSFFLRHRSEKHNISSSHSYPAATKTTYKMHCNTFRCTIWVIFQNVNRHQKHVQKCSKCMHLSIFFQGILSMIDTNRQHGGTTKSKPITITHSHLSNNQSFFHKFAKYSPPGKMCSISSALNRLYLVSHFGLAMSQLYSNWWKFCSKVKKT